MNSNYTQTYVVTEVINIIPHLTFSASVDSFLFELGETLAIGAEFEESVVESVVESVETVVVMATVELVDSVGLLCCIRSAT